jgi:hypothetical protein
MRTERCMDRRQSLKELAASGSPVDVLVADQQIPDVEIDFNPTETRIVELKTGLAAYLLYLRIINRTSRGIHPLDCDLSCTDGDRYFMWLPDPEETRSRDYRFARGQLEFARDQVLNHVLLRDGAVLKPGYPYQGYLLAEGGPLPDHWRHTRSINATLTIIASDDCHHAKDIRLGIECGAVKPQFAKRRSNLFEEAGKDHLGSLDPARSVRIPSRNSTASPSASTSSSKGL